MSHGSLPCIDSCLKVDIIVPVHGSLQTIDALLDSLACQSFYIKNILLVVSQERDSQPSGYTYTRESLEQILSRSTYTYKDLKIVALRSNSRLFPGAARNIGILYSDSKYLAFLDVNTLPGPQWLAHFAVSYIRQQTPVPMLGATTYTHDTYLKKVVIASSYGFLPIETLPGSIIAREHIRKVGLFNPSWRAGEDIDLVVRLKSLFPQYLVSPIPGRYMLSNNSLIYYFMKWLRNYSVSAPYQSLAIQSHALMSMTLILCLLIVFSWNAVVADWDETSSLYLGNVTKYSLIALILTYTVLRGWYLPLRKGAFRNGICSLSDVPSILIVSAILDLSKTIALLLRPLSTHRSARVILNRVA